jgi:tetratricopeptide (TPR) repeat protein
LHNDRARVNLQLGNLKEFIDDALSYFMFDDDVESSLFDLFLYMDDADFLKVEALLPDMLNDKSNCNLVNRFIASIYFKRKDLLKFTKYLLSLDEDCITFSDYMKITDNFFSIGDYETSLKYVDRASELMPEDEYPLFYKLHILTSDKQYDEVIALCNKRLSEKEIDDNSSFFYKMRAVSKSLKNDYDGAIADFTQALQLCNNWNYGMSQQRADLYMVKGEKELALMDYKRTVEMDLNPEITSCAHYVFMLLGEQE